MAWVAVDKYDIEVIYDNMPERNNDMWEDIDYRVCGEIEYEYETGIILPKGSIKKLIGRDLTWSDEPVELKEE